MACGAGGGGGTCTGATGACTKPPCRGFVFSEGIKVICEFGEYSPTFNLRVVLFFRDPFVLLKS